jgi:hypothetical protein
MQVITYHSSRDGRKSLGAPYSIQKALGPGRKWIIMATVHGVSAHIIERGVSCEFTRKCDAQNFINTWLSGKESS